LRTRCFAGWRSSTRTRAGTPEATRTWCSKTGPRAKTRTCAWGACTGTTGAGITAGSGASGMLGARSAWELPGGRGAAAGALRIAARSGRGTVAIKDGSAALNSATCACCLIAGAGHGCGRGYDGCLVYRSRTGLRHHHASHRWRLHRRSSLAPFMIERGCLWDVRLNRRGYFRFRSGSSGFDNGRSGADHRLNRDGRRGHGGGLNCRGRNKSGRWRCGYRRLDGSGRRGRLRSGPRLGVARGRGNRRLDDRGSRRRSDNDNRAHGNGRACGSLGNHGAGGRSRGDGRRRRSNHDGRRLARLRNNATRCRWGRRCCSRRWCRDHRRYRRRRASRRSGWPSRGVTLPCFLFFLLLVGQDGLHYIAGLGDVREVDFWSDALRGTRTRGAGMAAGPRSMRNVRADLLRFKLLQRTGVGLAAGQAEFRQYIKNLPTLDFHLAREIVDSNLTHPPLFEICYPSRLVAHSYLMALAALQTSVNICLAWKAAHLSVVLFACLLFCLVQICVQKLNFVGNRGVLNGYLFAGKTFTFGF
jgi:hypothetical protein